MTEESAYRKELREFPSSLFATPSVLGVLCPMSTAIASPNLPVVVIICRNLWITATENARRRNIYSRRRAVGILYRAVDSSGSTIDFLLSPYRDAVAAKSFLQLVIAQSGRIRPRVINVDCHPAYPVRSHAMLLRRCLRRSAYSLGAEELL